MNAPATLPLADLNSWAERAVHRLVRRALHQLKPRPPLTYGEWAERYRILSTEESADYGGRPFSLDNTPGGGLTVVVDLAAAGKDRV